MKKSDNVFAIVIWTVLIALKEKRISGEELAFEKLNIIRELMHRNAPARKIRSLLNYIRFYIKLKDEKLNEKFENEVLRITGNKNIMGVQEILLEQAKDQGMKIGWGEGKKEGRPFGTKLFNREETYPER